MPRHFSAVCAVWVRAKSLLEFLTRHYRLTLKRKTTTWPEDPRRCGVKRRRADPLRFSAPRSQSRLAIAPAGPFIRSPRTVRDTRSPAGSPQLAVEASAFSSARNATLGLGRLPRARRPKSERPENRNSVCEYAIRSASTEVQRVRSPGVWMRSVFQLEFVYIYEFRSGSSAEILAL